MFWRWAFSRVVKPIPRNELMIIIVCNLFVFLSSHKQYRIYKDVGRAMMSVLEKSLRNSSSTVMVWLTNCEYFSNSFLLFCYLISSIFFLDIMREKTFDQMMISRLPVVDFQKSTSIRLTMCQIDYLNHYIFVLNQMSDNCVPGQTFSSAKVAILIE